MSGSTRGRRFVTRLTIPATAKGRRQAASPTVVIGRRLRGSAISLRKTEQRASPIVDGPEVPDVFYVLEPARHLGLNGDFSDRDRPAVAGLLDVIQSHSKHAAR